MIFPNLFRSKKKKKLYSERIKFHHLQVVLCDFIPLQIGHVCVFPPSLKKNTRPNCLLFILFYLFYQLWVHLDHFSHICIDISVILQAGVVVVVVFTTATHFIQSPGVHIHFSQMMQKDYFGGVFQQLSVCDPEV